MHTSEPDMHKGSAVIIVDALNFRRAGLIAVLNAWAISSGWTLMPVADVDFSKAVSCNMFILNLGGRSISDSDHLRWIGHVREQPSEKPFVIMSDRQEPDEMLRAFDAGASGFIPTSLSPEIVFHALTFITVGGSFFPPSVLLSVVRDQGSSIQVRNRKSRGAIVLEPPKTIHHDVMESRGTTRDC